MAHTIRVTVTATLERTSGKFASKDEMVDAIREEIEGMDPGSILGLGADGESEYEITEWQVEDA